MSVLVSATPVYDMLVGHQSRGTFPDSGSLGINNKDVGIRRRFQQQQIKGVSTGSVISAIPGAKLTTLDPVGATGVFTVADNDFSGGAEITIGDFVLEPTIDFVVGGTPAITATNIAASINNLPGFTATDALAVVTVVTDKGPNGNFQTFSLTVFGAVDNFTLIDPPNGTFANPNSSPNTQGQPEVGPPAIV